MKEKFKIRFWDEKNKRMVYEGEYPVHFKISIALLGCEINGKMVYDGDLLKSKYEINGEHLISKIPVVFENGSFYIDLSFKKDGTYLNLLSEWDEEIKVIGNIYEEKVRLTQHPRLDKM